MVQNSQDQFERRKVRKGRRLFNEGETGDFAYIVETGEITVYKNIEGNDIELSVLHPGEIFGEIAVLDGRRRMASAKATMDSTLIVVSPKALEERIEKSDKFVKTLLQILMSNLRDTHRAYEDQRHTFEGHIQSINRHINGMRDLAQLSHQDEFIEEVCPNLVKMRDNCDKLSQSLDKYSEKIKS
ncbi:putative cAMP-binding protein-catabolite gene activator and regulatory subunit of cAMP-dependent protein kinase [Candidatus Terasakiella magnetica]|uniref:Putative cAMP-binding protein-catabolite gene activator and regulatory subunit of cAMP-dependent protein kinase n=1 Tax=Candidatus Terasakiella magnetica TaxID=1867952 RepID=A0A1C3RHZ5_9PROT|nr:cyclic nucleotide-binding domain-containing protein [Candidatus Terasakiella magnetica]SCA56900.1 putative cAMP-binding protein-catabolite gene activator and regulatory subunit of cAMP-dependent protein kinase [Candidatus Terasakiella magnetica]